MSNKRAFNPFRSALTLMELLVVLAILAALAAILVPLLSSSMQITVSKDASGNSITKSPQQIATEATMKQLRDTIAGTPDRPGYWNDVLAYSGDPNQLHITIGDLFNNNRLPSSLQQFNPNTRRGWRGPYLLNETGTYPDPTLQANIVRGFTSDYGAKGDSAMIDAWGNPIVIQWPTGTSIQWPTGDPIGHVRLCPGRTGRNHPNPVDGLDGDGSR